MKEISKRAVNIDWFVYLYAYGENYEILNEKIRKCENVKKEENSEKTFCIKVISFLNWLKRKEKVQKMESLDLKPFKGKC